MRSRYLQFTGFAASMVALFVMVGGHWGVLQSIAWGRMIADYSRTETLMSAIEKTFDGEDPCDLCLDIREGRAQEEQQTPVVEWKNLPEFVGQPSAATVPCAPRFTFDLVASAPDRPSDFIFTPPTPPPRTA